jgi:hypothetical protein
MNHHKRRITSVIVFATVLVACSAGSESIPVQRDDQVQLDPDAVAAARDRADNEADIAVATATTDPAARDTTSPLPDAGEAASRDTTTQPEVEPDIEVAEAEQDELDGLLNSLTVFNGCLSDAGFEFEGAPGVAGATTDQFEATYLQALGACATSSNILDSFNAFSEAQDNRTPEEIEQFNLGLLAFRDCVIGLGWEVGELIPDERGALTFNNALVLPAGSDGFGTDDVSSCRLEAEQFVADQTADSA